MNQMILYHNNQRSDLMLRKTHDSITIEEAKSIRRACDMIYERSKYRENDD
jgi:hypothetical protein